MNGTKLAKLLNIAAFITLLNALMLLAISPFTKDIFGTVGWIALGCATAFAFIASIVDGREI